MLMPFFRQFLNLFCIFFSQNLIFSLQWVPPCHRIKNNSASNSPLSKPIGRSMLPPCKGLICKLNLLPERQKIMNSNWTLLLIKSTKYSLELFIYGSLLRTMYKLCLYITTINRIKYNKIMYYSKSYKLDRYYPLVCVHTAQGSESHR